MLRHIEVQALANPDANVHFALLSDFTDAVEATRSDDDAILAAASRGIADLNATYGPRPVLPLPPRAALERVRGPVDGVGAQAREARGAQPPPARRDRHELRPSGRGPLDPASVRYVLTLDSDTRLPRDAARTLVGILEHPLNRPRLDPVSRRVVAGYGILQPRIAIATTSATALALRARLLRAHGRRPVHDRGLGHVPGPVRRGSLHRERASTTSTRSRPSLEGRVPENSLLSHDLFEGLHARTALVTDVEVVDDYPGNVLAHARRQHRWVRGDWQILRWLLPLVPTRAGLERNPLPLISQWKILDNLRRSLLPPTLFALIVAGLTVLPGPSWAWVLLAFGVLALPLVSVARLLLGGPRPQQPVLSFVRELGQELEIALAQAVVGLAFLAALRVRGPPRDRPDARARRRDGPAPPRVGDRGDGRRPRGRPHVGRPALVLPRDGGEPARGRPDRHRRRGGPAVRAPSRGAPPRPLGPEPSPRVVAQPRGPFRDARPRPRGSRVLPGDGAGDVAVLRGDRARRRERPRARQRRPARGGRRARRRAADVSDEHRPRPALGPRRPRLRLAGRRGPARADREDAAHGREPRTLERDTS